MREAHLEINELTFHHHPKFFIHMGSDLVFAGFSRYQ